MKYAGAFLILVCSLLAGAGLSARTGEACDVSEEIFRIMKYVREQICVNKTPTKVLLSRVPSRLDVSEAAEKGLYGALADSLAKLDESERRIFSSFCECMGKGGADVQRAGFDALISRYEASLQERRRRDRDKGRVYTACSLFLGVCAVIIFF